MQKNYLKQANDAFNEKQYNKAIDLYEKVIILCPEMRGILEFNILFAKNRSKFIKEGVDSILNRSTESKDELIIRLEGVDLNSAKGWAINQNDAGKPVFLQVCLDNRPLHIVDTHKQRDDVKKAYGGDGFSGYYAELNEYLDFDGDSLVKVKPIGAVLSKNNKPEQHAKKIENFLKGQHFFSVNEKAKRLVNKNIKDYIFKNSIDSSESKLVSIIILNLNGLEVLRRCINSIFENVKCNFELIIVDHHSTDGSIDYLREINKKNIRAIFRNKNYSFSDSNNYAAKIAKGDVFIFMNNDMILEDDVISKIADAVRYSEFGLVGAKLWDLPQGLAEDLSKKLLVTQHVGVHFKDSCRSNLIEAYESRPGVYFADRSGIYETPAATAALLGISAEDFEKIGGYDGQYFYGQEDVDFCLKYLKSGLRKTGVILDSGAFHARGLSRRTLSKNSGTSYLKNNREILQKNQSQWFRNFSRTIKINRPGYINPKPYSIAMIVSDISFETDKADYFTARELGDAFELKDDFSVGYFESSAAEIDVNGYDCILVFIDGFDPGRLKNISNDAVIVGWARNWFDRWCERPWIYMYDMLFASSEFARSYMEKKLHRKVGLLRIAASQACIEKNSSNLKFQSDYCFTGSYFNSPREIAEQLNPDELPFKFNLYGHNWESHENFSKFTKGPVSYEDIPDVYASTKLVIDDANIATKKWGALNCRIYDALAAGAFCITNNTLGAREIFGDSYLTYDSKGSLHQGIEKLLGNDIQRDKILNKFRNEVLSKHTYSHRRDSLIDALKLHSSKRRIAIKISAPDLARAKSWGDFYFARAIAKEFENKGYVVRIDCIDQWYSSRTISDDIVINLRGLSRYKPNNTSINIIWVISHPDLLSIEELNDYNKIFVASAEYTKKLRDFSESSSIEYLPQASEFDFNSLDLEKLSKTPAHEILFVGNSRNQYRKVVEWCVKNKLPISVYGQGWEKFIPKTYIVADFVENSDLPYLYNRAGVVLNDHWDDMRKFGFISNRVWDVLSVNGIIVTDDVKGIEDIDSSKVFVYSDEKSMIKAISEAKNSVRHDCSVIIDNKSFKDRVDAITKFLASGV